MYNSKYFVTFAYKHNNYLSSPLSLCIRKLGMHKRTITWLVTPMLIAGHQLAMQTNSLCVYNKQVKLEILLG